MRTLVMFAALIIFGVIAIFTNQLWLFIIPALFIGFSLLLPTRKKSVEEDIETEEELLVTADENEKMLGYAEEYPQQTTESKFLDDDDDFDLDDFDIDDINEEELFADLNLDLDDEELEVDLELDDEPKREEVREPVIEDTPSPSFELTEPISVEEEEVKFDDIDFNDLIDEPVTPTAPVTNGNVMGEEDIQSLLNDELEELLETDRDNERVEDFSPSFSEVEELDPDEIVMDIPDDFIKEEDDEKALALLKESALEELDQLIGLEHLKGEIKRVMKFLEVEKRKQLAGMKTEPITLHMSFLGDAGTGKTTIARIIAKLLKGIGILESGQYIETDRSGLVASYVGQTGIKTKELVQQAMGGILFIDEAYSLANGGPQDFGQEAIDTLIKEMEDNRDKFVTILAGYDEEMQTLFSKNQGFESRVRYHFQFPNYTVDELMELAMLMLKKIDLQPTEEAKEQIRAFFIEEESKNGYVKGNGRTVRNLIDQIKVNQNNRIIDTDTNDLMTVLPEDIPFEETTHDSKLTDTAIEEKDELALLEELL